MQYAEANRPDDVPCDDPERGCPFNPSPGDTGPDGCGLLPENQDAVDFWQKWHRLGEPTFQLIQLEFESPQDAEDFTEKLCLIQDYAPLIEQRTRARQESSKDKEKHQRAKRKR